MTRPPESDMIGQIFRTLIWPFLSSSRHIIGRPCAFRHHRSRRPLAFYDWYERKVGNGKGMTRGTEDNSSCTLEPGPDRVNHRFAVNNTIILCKKDPMPMKKNVPDIVRWKIVISLGCLENKTTSALSAYNCLVAGHGITRPMPWLSLPIRLTEQERHYLFPLSCWLCSCGRLSF